MTSFKELAVSPVQKACEALPSIEHEERWASPRDSSMPGYLMTASRPCKSDHFHISQCEYISILLR